MDQATSKTKRVALLGGSFDPAHAGHLAVSMLAIYLLPIDEVWWIVSPQHSLKVKPRFSFTERLLIAEGVAQDAKVKIVDLEKDCQQSNTHATVKKLQVLHPNTQFAWLLGADSFATLTSWQDWQELVKLLPFVVVSRNGYNDSALNSPAAKFLADSKLPKMTSADLAASKTDLNLWQKLPCWLFIDDEVASLASTRIKK